MEVNVIMNNVFKITAGYGLLLTVSYVAYNYVEIGSVIFLKNREKGL